MTAIIIGAMDGTSFDNVFDKLNDYKKVLFVEPIPFYNKLLKLNSQKLKCEVLFEDSPISNIQEDVEIAYLDINAINNYESFYQGCSSVIKYGEPINIYLKKLDKDIIRHSCKTITFDMLCDKWGIKEVDYLQIDTEGYDQRIVDSIDLDKYNIKKLKFETHYLNNDFIELFSNKWNNYKYKFIEGDVIFNKL